MMLLQNVRPFSTAGRCCGQPTRSASRPNWPRPLLRVVASGNGSSGASFAEGSAVKVVKPLKVYHVPKRNDGINLEGMEGIVQKDVSQYKGKTLSANLPYKVEFKLEQDGKTTKFFAHVAPEELQQV